MRSIITPAPTIRRRLAAMIEGEVDSVPRPEAVMIASGQVGLFNAWLSGECVATPDEMAATLVGQGA